MKIVILLMVVVLASCSETPVEPVKKQPTVKKVNAKDTVLKGYQDNIQKAKDMEQTVLKAAEDKKKKIDEASN